MEERQEIYNVIVERLTAMLGDGNYDESTEYAGLNMKSVNFSSMITYLEDEFDLEINFMEFKRKKTIGESVDYIVALMEE